MHKIAGNILIVMLLSCWTTLSASAFELGMTPTHVYGLWLNINKVYLEHLKLNTDDPQHRQKLTHIYPRDFSLKRPVDVYNKARELQNAIAKDFDLGEVPPPPQWVRDLQIIEGKTSESDVTPSKVFMLSSWFLNKLVEEYVRETNAQEPISSFYEEFNLSNKVPSDVFSQIDLMARRMELFNQLKGQK